MIFQRVSQATVPTGRGALQAMLHRSMYTKVQHGRSQPAHHCPGVRRASAQERTIWNLAKGFGFGATKTETTL